MPLKASSVLPQCLQLKRRNTTHRAVGWALPAAPLGVHWPFRCCQCRSPLVARLHGHHELRPLRLRSEVQPLQPILEPLVRNRARFCCS